MRNEEVMMELILKRAVEDETIRLVEMNGSRINPTTKRDPFQDYDIVYYVEDMEPFLKDHLGWTASEKESSCKCLIKC